MIDDPDMANVNILLRCWTSMNVMPKVATEGTPLGSCTILVVKEVSLRVSYHRCRGRNGGRNGRWNRGGRLCMWLWQRGWYDRI